MPTYVITDDTNSLCLAITGGETKNIDKDNAVVRVIPAGTGLNTTAIDQLSIEHDGDYATRMPWNDVTVSGVSPSSVSDFRTKVMTILNNNSSGGGSTAPITVDLSDAGVMLAGVPAFPVEGQVYLINGLGITGVDNIRTVGILDVNTSDYVFNNNCEAYVTALGVYVPCSYDVATNALTLGTIEKKITLSAAQLKVIHGTPVVVVPAMGAGTAIQIMNAAGRLNWGGQAFDAGASLDFHCAGNTSALQFTIPLILAGSSSAIYNASSTDEGTDHVGGLAENTNLVVSDIIGEDGTHGDSTIDLYISYKIIIL